MSCAVSVGMGNTLRIRVGVKSHELELKSSIRDHSMQARIGINDHNVRVKTGMTDCKTEGVLLPVSDVQ